MEAIDLLLSRRSVLAASMTTPGPTEEDLSKILTSGIRVPDHGKLAPWRIQIIRPESQRILGEFNARLFKEENPDANERMIEAERKGPQRAPILICVTAKLDPEKHIPMMEQRLSGGALCINILNASSALGYAAQWLTGWHAYHDKVKQFLGHAPDVDIIGFIYIGSAKEAPRDRPRVGVDEVVSDWSGPAEETN